MYNILWLILLTLSVEYLDQLLGAARQVNVVYLAKLLGAVIFIHFISNHNIAEFKNTVNIYLVALNKKAVPKS